MFSYYNSLTLIDKCVSTIGLEGGGYSFVLKTSYQIGLAK